MRPDGFNRWLESRRDSIDRRLRQLLPSPDESRLAEAMAYAVLGGGKRLRPLACIDAAESLGARAGHALRPACAVELVHCYSLVHDDLPAMDDDDLRRGKPSCHAKYGEAVAILAGDSLLTLAFGVLAPRGERSVRVLADTVGHRGMTHGQMLDLELARARRKASAREVADMHRMKTARLFGAATRLGAIAAGAGPGPLASMTRVGEGLGRLCQLVDDIIDEDPGAQAIGKTPGKDRRQGKATAVTTQGMARSVALARKEHADVLGRLRRMRLGHTHLADVADLLAAPLRAAPAARARR